VVRGTLWNGLRYYIRPNHEPRARAELRLVVDVGSVLEDDDQRGLAHFAEHMAFNGTRRFEKNELVSWLEGVGMRFGPDVNAYTGFDETVYMLTLPTDTAGVLETGFDVLEDWAHGVTFDTTEVRKERGVVIEEWRLGRGAGARVQERQMPVLFRASRYARRSPIGDPATIATFDQVRLWRFYRDWYRPDLMAVVAVGDFDAAEVERMIRARFSLLVPPPDPRPRRRFGVPRARGTQFSVTTDPELTSSSVTVVHTAPARVRRSVEAYREGLVEALYSGMLIDRLNELTQRPDAPFLGVSSFSGSLVRPLDASLLSAEVGDAGAERGLAALLSETRRAAQHGFTAGELAREKADQLRAWEQIHAERSRTTSSQFAGQFVAHFLYGGALLEVGSEYELVQRLMPDISLSDVDERARAWQRARDRTVLISGPQKEGVAMPGRDALNAVVDSVGRLALEPYREDVSDAPLVRTPPVPGRVVAERALGEVGATEWTLSNGVRVVLKPTDFRDDELLLIGRSPGGTSMADDRDHLAAQTAAAAVQVGGVGDLSVVDLQKRLAGKAASVGPDLGELHEGMSGIASPRDVGTLLELTYLYFTAPRRDSLAWEAYLERARETLRNRGASPEGVFQDTLASILSGGAPRARPLTAASFDSVSLDRALAVYRDRYGDASDFTFFVVGAFQPDSLRPLVERWLGSLPAGGRREAARDVRGPAPAGVVRRVVRRGLEPKGRTQLVFHGPLDFARGEALALRTLADVLQIRLRDRLREDLGGTYGVAVAASAAREPRQEYRFVIDFGSAPERLDELTAVVFAEIEALRRDGPGAAEMAKVREEQRREKEVSLRDNGWWATQLMTFHRYGWDPAGITAPGGSGPHAAPEAVRDAARRYLDPQRHVQVSLLPEAAPAERAAR
jgi:zinc protease